MDAGIHRLPAGDNDYVTQTIKQLEEAISTGHCYHGDIHLRHSFSLHLDEFDILVIHVVNSDVMQLAQLGDIFQDFTGLEAMDMNSHQSIVACNYQGLSFPVEVFL